MAEPCQATSFRGIFPGAFLYRSRGRVGLGYVPPSLHDPQWLRRECLYAYGISVSFVTQPRWLLDSCTSQRRNFEPVPCALANVRKKRVRGKTDGATICI